MIFFIAFAGCINPGGKNINEGIITYDIQYITDKNTPNVVSLFPEQMQLKFKKDNTVINITGFMGCFNLMYITNLNSNTNYSVLRFLDKKYLYKADINEFPFGYTQMRKMKITYVNDTLTIAGYLCRKALAYCPEIGRDPLELWYTDRIGIQNPNTNNPFREIKGVLLGFQVRLSNIDMCMRAVSVEKAKVDDKEFAIPENCRVISRDEMEQVIGEYTATADSSEIAE